VTRAVTVLAVALVFLLPRIAEACPVCMAKDPNGTAKLVALGGFILLPLFIVLVVVRAIRSSDEETDQ
jgi:hypothetical protein